MHVLSLCVTVCVYVYDVFIFVRDSELIEKEAEAKKNTNIKKRINSNNARAPIHDVLQNICSGVYDPRPFN